MKVLLVNGSVHPKGSTNEALTIISERLNKLKIDTDIFHLIEPIRDCLGCHACGKLDNKCIYDDDCVNKFISLVKQGVDGFIFGSPVYYAHASGRLLSFMDRVFYSSSSLLRYKPASSVCVARRAGTVSSIDDINKYFLFNRMPIVSSCYWNEIHGNNAEELRRDLEGVQILTTLADNMAWLLQCIDVAKKSGINYPSIEDKIKTNFIR